MHIRVDRMVKNVQSVDFEIRASEFLMNHVLRYGMVDGKVEKWILIVDFKNVSITSIPREVSAAFVLPALTPLEHEGST